MHVSLNWLKDFVDIPSSLDPKNLADQLTLKTAEVEGVHEQGKGLTGVVVGEILEIKKHPDADKLNLAKVNIGKKEPLSLIFGSMLVMKIGDKVPVAVAPTTLPTGMVIEKRKMRGELSEGMLCLDQELGLKAEGITIQYFPDLKPGTPIREAMDLDDVILEFDNKSLTHRPDLWSHYGIAREISVITDTKFKEIKPTVDFPEKGESLDVEIKDPTLCPRYCGLIIKNIKVAPSPEWLQKRLKAIGYGVHNNIVDITNYVMAELGQPMHAFDQNYIKKGIIVKTAKKGEKIKALDDKEYKLEETDLIIADHEKTVALAGIIGAQDSGINDQTTSIILEAANFHAGTVRKASARLNLRTEAVQRFEKSLDPHLPLLAITRATELILEICPGAKIAGPITDNKNFDPAPLKVTLDCEKTASKIGADISQKLIAEILTKLGFQSSPAGKSTLTVTVPHFRPIKDIEIEDDLIEEVARIYSYEKIPTSLPTLPTKLPIDNPERSKKHRVRELLSFGLGFDEIYNYSFYSKADLSRCLMSENAHLKVLNYLSEDQTHMRLSLIPNLMKNIQQNTKNFDQFRIYEIGRTYKEIGNYMPLEEKWIAGAIVKKGRTDELFYEAKGAVEEIFKKFNVGIKLSPGDEKTPYAHPVKALNFLDQKSGETLARVFILHPQVIKNHDLEKYSIAMFELNFSELMKKEHPLKKFSPLPKFPSIEIDVSVVVDKTIETAKIEKAILAADKELIVNVALFDIYEGEGIEQNKKAAAFKITLQAADRTLTDEEMARVQKKIFQNLENLGGKIRGK